jgi:hypothetical protein
MLGADNPFGEEPPVTNPITRYLNEEAVLLERQKSTPTLAFDGEEPRARRGAFKVSSKLLKMWKSDVGTDNPAKLLFKQVQDRIAKVPRQELPKIWGADNMADAQDIISGKPRKAFQMWMRNVKKADSKMAGYIKRLPENLPLVYYGYMARVVGNEMADIIFKRYFETDQAFKPRRKRPKA